MRCTDMLFPMVPSCLLNSREMNLPIKTWFLEGDYEIDSASSASPFPIIRNATKSFESTLAREVDRFLCAMAESYAELQPSSFASRSIGWSLIRAYYASYFAAHALLRMCGRCITQIDGSTSHSIMRSLRTTGDPPAWQIGTSQYFVKYDEVQQLLLFEDKHTAKGGSHQFVWKKFGELLEELINFSREKGVAYQPEMLLFERIADTLTMRQTNQEYSWLSTVRNNVNYSFAHSVWFPFDGLKNNQSNQLISMLKCKDSQDDFINHANHSSELAKFCEASSFLVSFANSAANTIAFRSNTRTFMSRSFIKLQKLVNMPH